MMHLLVVMGPWVDFEEMSMMEEEIRSRQSMLAEVCGVMMVSKQMMMMIVELVMRMMIMFDHAAVASQIVSVVDQ